MPNEIRVRDVHKAFGETRALRGCSFAAHGGEVHAIVGENGSGKSTLAKILSGVLRADSGEVSVAGQTPTSPIDARRLGIATIFQEVLVAEQASVFANLFVGADSTWALTQNSRARREMATKTMARLTGQAIDIDAPAGSYPLSIKQWIVIARAILTRPRYVIFDESSAALDLDATVRLHNEIRTLREDGACIIIVTHRIAELVRIADRATILRDGESVTTLEKSEINEASLMALMTPASRQASAMRATAVACRQRGGSAVLRATALVLTAGSRAFDFAVQRGEIVGVTGLDGQGHDLFVKCLAGVARPASAPPVILSETGEAKPLASLQEAQDLGIAYVSGDRKRDGIFPDLSIYENLTMALYRRTARRGWIRHAPLARAYRAEVARLSIKTNDHRNRITSLSGGNQQKILIGRAFASRPAVIVLNDPARGVDLATKRELYEELRKFAAAGGAVVYLSSEIEEFIGFADRVEVFRDFSRSESLSGEQIDEEPILAAMFGHRPSDSHLFESAEEAVA